MLYNCLIWYTVFIGTKHGFSFVYIQNQDEILEHENKQAKPYSCKYKSRIKQNPGLYHSQQNDCQIRRHTHNATLTPIILKKQQPKNFNSKITALAALVGWDNVYNQPNLCSRVCCCSNKKFSLHGGFPTDPMHPHNETPIKLSRSVTEQRQLLISHRHLELKKTTS